MAISPSLQKVIIERLTGHCNLGACVFGDAVAVSGGFAVCSAELKYPSRYKLRALRSVNINDVWTNSLDTPRFVHIVQYQAKPAPHWLPAACQRLPQKWERY